MVRVLKLPLFSEPAHSSDRQYSYVFSRFPGLGILPGIAAGQEDEVWFCGRLHEIALQLQSGEILGTSGRKNLFWICFGRTSSCQKRKKGCLESMMIVAQVVPSPSALKGNCSNCLKVCTSAQVGCYDQEVDVFVQCVFRCRVGSETSKWIQEVFHSWPDSPWFISKGFIIVLFGKGRISEWIQKLTENTERYFRLFLNVYCFNAQFKIEQHSEKLTLLLLITEPHEDWNNDFF